MPNIGHEHVFSGAQYRLLTSCAQCTARQYRVFWREHEFSEAKYRVFEPCTRCAARQSWIFWREHEFSKVKYRVFASCARCAARQLQGFGARAPCARAASLESVAWVRCWPPTIRGRTRWAQRAVLRVQVIPPDRLRSGRPYASSLGGLARDGRPGSCLRARARVRRKPRLLLRSPGSPPFRTAART